MSLYGATKLQNIKGGYSIPSVSALFVSFLHTLAIFTIRLNACRLLRTPVILIAEL